MKFANTLALSAVVAMGSTAIAQAAIIDFTDPDAYSISGSTGSAVLGGGVSLEIASVGGTLNNSEAGPGAVAAAPLSGIVDGLGIRDDEVTFPRESLTLTFSRAVTISSIFALDLFGDIPFTVDGAGDLETDEGFTVNGGDPFLAQVLNSDDTIGFGSFSGLSFTGTTFTFAAISTNDRFAAPDFALAGLEFEVAPVPLPAGILLLGGALGGLGLARRKKKAA